MYCLDFKNIKYHATKNFREVKILQSAYVVTEPLPLSVLTDRMRDEADDITLLLLVGGAFLDIPAFCKELLLEALLIVPSSCFCLAGSSELRKLSA